ncbi:hypothetical protein [Agrobacterium rosae]|uniref:hypothetical protein n=1 Tax=Agrobacterium rosae TaxID=1972867 RepID=UPI000CD98D18|nr:hypothetical protein [Agrobacterium rosae]POO56277.1 hypothetical protein CTT39_05955 [Agrobacterium rosae]
MGGVFTGVLVAVLGTIISLFVVDWFNEDDAGPKRPELSIVTQSVRVPARPIPYDVRMRANPQSKDLDLEKLFEFASVGFTVVQYDLINETQTLLRDVEVSAPDAEELYQLTLPQTVSLDKRDLKVNIPPGQKLRLIALQRYSEPSVSATYGDRYFTPVDTSDYAKSRGEIEATDRIERRYYLIGQPLVDALIVGLLSILFFLAIGFFPSIWRLYTTPKSAPPPENDSENAPSAEKAILNLSEQKHE